MLAPLAEQADELQLRGNQGQIPPSGAGDKSVNEPGGDHRDGKDQADQNQGPDMNRLVIFANFAPTNLFAHLHHSL